jgi:PD-(D/E)XK nuclease superfamily protein
MRCPRKHDLMYVQGWSSPETSSALEIGTSVHEGLKVHYSGGDLAEWIGLAEYQELSESEDGTLSKETEMSLIMLQGYMEWLEETGEDAHMTPELVEKKLSHVVEVPGFGPVEVHGTVDWTARDGLGRLFLVDHKTVAAFGILADRRLQLNFQLQTYAWLLWRATGERPDGVMLNMLRKVKRTAASKPPFYAREYVSFNPKQLEGFEAQLIEVIRRMLDSEGRIAYAVPDQDCNWKCPFLQVCPLLDDGSDIQGALNDLYVRSDGRKEKQ